MTLSGRLDHSAQATLAQIAPETAAPASLAQSQQNKLHIRNFRRLRLVLSAPRLLPHVLLLLGSAAADVLNADMRRWAELWHLDPPSSRFGYARLLVELMTFAKEFRNIYYYRLGMKAKLWHFLCPSLATLEIHTADIGPGLFIAHGFGTIIAAKQVGRNFMVHHGVTVGYANDMDAPVIGDDVRMGAGAKVIGKARIGDYVTVGPNSVVLEDVPSYVTVLGIPAQVIRRHKAREASGS